MPELPEIETIVRQMSHEFTGQIITNIQIFNEKSIKLITPSIYIDDLKNRKIKEITRKGKFIVVSLEIPDSNISNINLPTPEPSVIINKKNVFYDTLYFHLGMTGSMRIYPDSIVPPIKHIKIVLNLNNNLLIFTDPRGFGFTTLSNHCISNSNNSYLPKKGFNPLTISAVALKKLTMGQKGLLKAWLLNQKYLSGLGNIYVDESLWKAKLSPKRITKTLSIYDCEELTKAMKEVLSQAITHHGSSIRDFVDLYGNRGTHQNYLFAYGNKGRCVRCFHDMTYARLAERGTYFCEFCQQ